MTNTKHIVSEYNLNAIITLILPTWLEKLHFLLSLQSFLISTTELTIWKLCNEFVGGVTAGLWADSTEQEQNM